MLKSIFLLFSGLLLVHRTFSATVTFRVDMSNETVSVLGVHVAGSFQSETGLPADWNPAGSALTDANGDNIYELTVNLPAGGYFFKYVNGNSWPTAEVNLTSCGVGTDYNRVMVVGSSDTLLPIVVFNKCTIPSGNYSTHWWNDAVFYEVFVRSFYDNNGDGRGDFAGLTAKLDYLNDGNPNTTTDLGITAIWLMPMMPSPSYHGYDVTNYKGVESDYGTMAQFDAFLAAAHTRGIKVILDLVLNHTSNQHPWFNKSASGAASPYRDWYVWSATNPGYPGPWGQNVWSLRSGNYYFNNFGSNMPDLNWRNAAVRDSVWDATRFWLNKGVDGYRLDAVKYLIEDSLHSAAQVKFENTVGTFSVLQEFHQVVRTAKPDAFTIGEAWSASTNVVPYVTQNRLDACFEFDQAAAIVSSVNTGTPANLRSQLIQVDQVYPRLQYGTFLTNHDQERVFSTFAGNTAKMKQAAALYLTLPGVPFLYYGEEVGMLGTGVDEDKRKPMQWTASANAGFSTATPWRPLNSNYALFNVATQEADPSSLLSHYKKLIAIRKENAALRKGYYLPTTASSARVLGYGRIHEQEATFVVANLGATPVNNCTISAGVSTLAEGTYSAIDIYTGLEGGTVSVSATGNFSNWLVDSLKANETRIFKLSIQTAVSKPMQESLSLLVYPNPANQAIQIALDQPTNKGQVRILDLTGRLNKEVSFKGSSLTIDSRNWKPGSYFLEVKTEKGVGVRRIVVGL